MINRLIEPSGGRILIDGTDVLKMDPVQLRRGIGYVIQQGGLFPHRRVADNVATVPAPARVGQGAGGRAGRRACWTSSACRPASTGGGSRTSSRAASASGWAWPARWAATPRSSSWTSRSRRSIPITRQRLQQELLQLQEKLQEDDRLRHARHRRGDPARATGSPCCPRAAIWSSTTPRARCSDGRRPPSSPTSSARTVACAAWPSCPSTPTRSSILPRSLPTSACSTPAPRPPEPTAAGRWWSTRPRHLHGWVDLEPGLTGSVEDNLRPFEVEVPLGTSLRAAFGEMLQHDVRWLPVVDEGRYLGVVTPNSLHAAVRRSVGGEAGRGLTGRGVVTKSASDDLERHLDVAPGGVAYGQTSCAASTT